MAKQTISYIGLGSNLGDREGAIRKTLKMLADSEQIEVVRVSDLIETSPLGDTEQPEYLNAVAEIKTSLTVEDLFKKTADIETSLGRTRGEKWSPRIIDLDILLFGSEVINVSGLTVPHPQMHLRSFVLKGLCQLNAKLLHPVLKEPIYELAVRLGGADFVLNPNLPQLISIAGIIGVGKTTLAKRLSNLLGGKCLFEPYDTNPFLADVYAGKKEVALDCQLYFLTFRARQLASDVLGRQQIYISDYIFDKELIYARRLLNTQQFALYNEIYPRFSVKITAPVLVIYMTDSSQNCLERIRKRGRPYEKEIQVSSLGTFASDYDNLFAEWKICPVIRLVMSKLDYTKDADIEHLANQIRSYVTI